MKYKKNLCIFLLFIMFIPFIVKADTWLDKEEYRDIYEKNTTLKMLNLNILLFGKY